MIERFETGENHAHLSWMDERQPDLSRGYDTYRGWRLRVRLDDPSVFSFWPAHFSGQFMEFVPDARIIVRATTEAGLVVPHGIELVDLTMLDAMRARAIELLEWES